MRLPGESEDAYGAFREFARTPPGRRYVPDDRIDDAETYQWAQRAREIDAERLRGAIETRETDRDLIRQRLIDASPRVVESLISLALAETIEPETGRRVPIHVPRSVQLGAIRETLSLAGVVAPKRVELSGPDGAPIQVQAAVAAARVLSLDEIRTLRAALETQRQPELEAEIVNDDGS